MSTGSSLSNLPPISSPSSFYTATGGSLSNAEDVTTLSSPAEPAGSPYRDAKVLPDELRQHVKIYLEEKMYTAAIQMMESLLSPGGSRHRSSARPALVPPPSQLAVLGTFVIHPRFTNRPTEGEDLLVATLSLTYLRNLLTTVGPVNANLRAAFEFKGGARGGRRCYGADAGLSEDEYSEDDHIRSRFSCEDSIWTRSQTFWKVLGWAFNCSVLHQQRWRYWKPWLEYMVQVLQLDFDERQRLDLEAHERSGAQDDCEYPLLQESLLFSYLGSINNRTDLKGIIKAISSDGSDSSTNIFQEIFTKETKSATQASNKRKREHVLDLENDQFGDYLDDDSPPSSQGSDVPSPEKVRGRKRATGKNKSSPPPTPGFVESVSLRLRLFYLLGRASLLLPDRFVKIHQVYDTFADALRELQVSFFASFVSSNSDSGLPRDAFVSLLRTLIQSYLPASAPKPYLVDPEADRRDGVSIPMLEHCYLPLAANNVAVENNAKMSLLVENLFRIVWVAGGIPWTEQLQKAVESGVQARNDKTKSRKNGRAKVDGNEELAREALDKSSQRLLTMMNVIKLDDEEGG